MDDRALERLLRSAARVEDAEVEGAPFGFATRVIAQWRAGTPSLNGNGIARLLRRVALVASVIIVVATAGAVREFRQTSELRESVTNDYAIADSAIDEEVLQ